MSASSSATATAASPSSTRGTGEGVQRGRSARAGVCEPVLDGVDRPVDPDQGPGRLLAAWRIPSDQGQDVGSLGIVQLACALLWYRRLRRLSQTTRVSG